MWYHVKIVHYFLEFSGSDWYRNKLNSRSVLYELSNQPSVFDFYKVVHYYESTASPNIIWVRLDELDFSNVAPVKMIDLVNGADRVSDVSSEFKNAEKFNWAKPTIGA